MLADVKIVGKYHEEGNYVTTEVWVDGKQMKGVREIRFSHDALGLPILSLDLNGFNVSIDSPMVRTNLKNMGGIGEMELQDLFFKKEETEE